MARRRKRKQPILPRTAEDWIVMGAALVIVGVVFAVQGKWQALYAIGCGFIILQAARRWRRDHPRSIETVRRREAIPEQVRREVWNRDGGRCRFCGTQEWLEYDHIVPWSKNGPSTARNLQLLCQTCNRKKGAR